MSNFKCIYCKKTAPEIKLSVSHIIPEAFGKGPTLKNAVCLTCNDKINKNVEHSLIEATAPLRNLLAIEGKRGKPSFKAKAKFGNAEFDVILRHPKDLEAKLFFFKNITGKDSKKKIAIIGYGDKFFKAQKRYEAKHNNVKWEDIAEEQRKIEFEFCMDLRAFFSTEALRLASKIAFELYCRERSPEVVEGYEFDAIRTFVRFGQVENNITICNVTIDPLILGGLGNIPIGIHSVYLDYNVDSRRIIAVVGLFGLVYYKVILTRYASIFTSSNSLFLFNPQMGEYKPTILISIRKPNIHLQSHYDKLAPKEALIRSHKEILKKLNNGFTEIYKNQE